MTTRTGFAGLLTGLAAALMLVYPLAGSWSPGSTAWDWPGVAAAAALAVGGGWLAARWSGSVQAGRCAALGALAGGLAGIIVFCLLGAAAAGLAAADGALRPHSQPEAIAAVIRLTNLAFLAFFAGGAGLGLLGGWLACPRRAGRVDEFDKSAPQMALNAAITAVPASVFSAALAGAIFSRLADSIAGQTGGAAVPGSILDMPLAVSLLLALVSHFALTLVVPHEAHQAEHLCGLDEVKMAAYVGIGAAPVLGALLFLVDARLFSKPPVLVVLLASAALSLKSLQALFGLVLPRRARFPAPVENRQKVEAKLFGTIASSRAPRLVTLCIGCGMLMILPFHIAVFSVLINLNNLLLEPSFTQSAPVEVARKLFLTQALVSGGLMAASATALTAVYLFYLNLGRWFKRRGARKLQNG